MNLRRRLIEAAFWTGVILCIWDFFEHSLDAGYHGSALIFSQIGLGGLHHFWYGIILIVTTWFLYDYHSRSRSVR